MWSTTLHQPSRGRGVARSAVRKPKAREECNEKREEKYECSTRRKILLLLYSVYRCLHACGLYEGHGVATIIFLTPSTNPFVSDSNSKGSVRSGGVALSAKSWIFSLSCRCRCCRRLMVMFYGRSPETEHESVANTYRRRNRDKRSVLLAQIETRATKQQAKLIKIAQIFSNHKREMIDGTHRPGTLHARVPCPELLRY